MNNIPILLYYNLKQLCEKLYIDLNQLKDIIKIHKVCLWIPIKNTDSVYETKANSLTDDEFFRLSKLSIRQIESEDWTITSLEWHDLCLMLSALEKSDLEKLEPFITNILRIPTSFHIKKGNAFCKILCNKNGVITAIQKPLCYSAKEKSNHDGYVELPEESPIRKYLNDKNIEDKTITIKSEKEGYTDILQSIEPIEDIYIRKDEVERLEKLIQETSLGIKPFDAISKSERDIRYQKRAAEILKDNTKLTKAQIAKQIHLEETNKDNAPPTEDRIIRIIRTTRQRQKTR